MSNFIKGEQKPVQITLTGQDLNNFTSITCALVLSGKNNKVAAKYRYPATAGYNLIEIVDAANGIFKLLINASDSNNFDINSEAFIQTKVVQTSTGNVFQAFTNNIFTVQQSYLA